MLTRELSPRDRKVPLSPINGAIHRWQDDDGNWKLEFPCKKASKWPRTFLFKRKPDFFFLKRYLKNSNCETDSFLTISNWIFARNPKFLTARAPIHSAKELGPQAWWCAGRARVSSASRSPDFWFGAESPDIPQGDMANFFQIFLILMGQCRTKIIKTVQCRFPDYTQRVNCLLQN